MASSAMVASTTMTTPSSSSRHANGLVLAAAAAAAALLGLGLLYATTTRSNNPFRQQQQQQQQQPTPSSSRAPLPPPPVVAAAPAAKQAKPKQPEKAEEEKAGTVKRQSDGIEVSRAELSQKESALGTQAFKSGSYALAIEHFTRAIDLCPADAKTSDQKKVILNNRAAAREKMQEWRECVQDASAAIALDATYKRAYARRAKAYEELGELSSALEDLSTWRFLEASANAADPTMAEDPQIEAAMQRVKQVMGKKEALDIWQHRQKQERAKSLSIPLHHCRAYYYSFYEDAAAMRSPQPRQAVQDALAEIDAEPRSSSAERVLETALMLRNRQEYEESVPLLERVIALSEPTRVSKRTKAEAYSELASLYHLSGDLLTAREMIESSLDLEPTIKALIKLASLAVEDGEYEVAKEHGERAESLLAGLEKAGSSSKVERANLNFHLSSYACLIGDLSTARERLELAIEQMPDYGIAHMQLGVVLYRQGLPEEALSALQQASLLVPELPEVHNFYGEVLMTVNRREEALAKFSEALLANDHCVLPLLNRGVMYMADDAETGEPPSQENLDSALRCFDEAIRIDPTCEIGYVHRATFFAHRGDFQSCIANFDLAIDHSKAVPDLIEYCALRAAWKAEEVTLNRLKPAN